MDGIVGMVGIVRIVGIVGYTTQLRRFAAAHSWALPWA